MPRKAPFLITLLFVFSIFAACDRIEDEEPDPETLIIQFDAQGGESVEEMTIGEDEIPDLPETTREGYIRRLVF